MGRWATGERAVEFLVQRGRLEAIAGEDLVTTSDALLERANRRVTTASAGLDLGDADGAYAAAYDAYRMAAESLLARQGLRATGGEGSHMTVEDAISAQFSSEIAAFTKPTFERMRRTRHTAQYFDPSAVPITRDDSAWAIEKAAAALAGVTRLCVSTPPGRFDGP